MDDMIYRQSAIDALDGEISVTGKENAETVIRYVKLVAEKINRLPTAQTERKRWKWIEDNDSIVHGHCLRCGWPAIWQETDVFGMNFCPNCGAEMERDDAEIH